MAADRSSRAAAGLPQEHRLAAVVGPGATRPGRAGGSARTPAPRARDPARGRARDARAQFRGDGATIFGGTLRAERGDDQPPASPAPGRRRAPAAAADGRHFLGTGQWVRPHRRLPLQRQRQGIPRVWARAGARWRKRRWTRLLAGDDHRPTQCCGPNLERVRADGFAVAVDELETGLAAIAVPVRGASGEVVAALSITGPTVRMTPTRITELCLAVVEESDRLSARVGYIEGGAHAA